MAAGSRRGGDLVLGGRHLVGIFALLVVILGVVFTLGYLLGRSRYEEQLRAATGAGETETASASAGTAAPGRSGSTPPADWEFYRSGEPAKTPELLPAPGKAGPPVPPKSVAAPVASGKSSESAATPSARPRTGSASTLIPKGAITLQVAALVGEADALALAQALQERKFPAIVTTPTVDKYYRVQVGPYPDAQSATAARRELEKAGFKPIVRR
jgi:cell division septation protein DedD